MGTPGSKCTLKKETIETALKDARGRITYAAKHLNVTHNTLRKRMKELGLMDLMDELRNEFDNTLLDSAENTLLYALSKKGEDLGNALKSTFYILNNKGKDRNYSPKNNPSNVHDSREQLSKELRDLEKFVKQADNSGKNASVEKFRKSTVENKQPILN